MIANERQYKITNSQMQKLKVAISAFDLKDTTSRVGSPVLAKAELDALRSEYENLFSQLQEYEVLKSGTVGIFKASSLGELPTILIKARIARGLSQRELAELLNVKEQQIQRYEAEEYASASLSRLSEVANKLGLSISEIAEFRIASGLMEIESGGDLPWKQFPVKDIYSRGWFEGFSGSLSDAINKADELVKDFVTKSLEKPLAAAARQRLRSNSAVNPYALLAWQCRVIALAEKRREKNKKKFKLSDITEEWLAKLARLSSCDDSPKKAVEYLENSGILLIVVPHLPNTYLDGAAFLLSSGPVIAMTLRYDKLDNFWFVLFHEIAHIIKHLHKGTVESIFDNLEADASGVEAEADDLASEVLIPQSKWKTALARYVRSRSAIMDFAHELEISPAIVAGKIRREANNYVILNDLIGQGEIRKLFPEMDFSL